MTAAILMTVLAGIAALVALRIAPRAASAPRRAARRRRNAHAEGVPEPLVRLEGLLTLAPGSALQTHARLRPLMQELAADRLARHGVLIADEDAARPLLGDELWELVRPDRPRPDDRSLAGAAPAMIEAFVRRLEEL
jgi:hypothetical protein